MAVFCCRIIRILSDAKANQSMECSKIELEINSILLTENCTFKIPKGV